MFSIWLAGVREGVRDFLFSKRAVEPPVPCEMPAVVAAAEPTPGMISFDGMVMYFLASGGKRVRADDLLIFDRPLAPNAPTPHLASLSETVARLPAFARQ